MSLSRRDFVRTVGVGAAGAWTSSLISLRTQEAMAFAQAQGLAVDGVINLANNENPLGAGKEVVDAINKLFSAPQKPAGRYPSRWNSPLTDMIAKKFNVKPENILVGAGSTQILVDVTHTFTSKEKALVGSLPTYEECFGYANLMGHKTKPVPLDRTYRMDLDQTLHACKGSGLLFYCNPNNPVSTLVAPTDTREFIPRALSATTDMHILADEAYFEYVTAPDHETLVPLAVTEPRLIVARTFSKAYGMAGLRIGYAIAHEKTIQELRKFHMGNSVSALSYVAAIAALDRDEKRPSYIPDEKRRNRKARDFALRFFRRRGYEATDSEANFIFVDIQMPVEMFQAACAKRGLRVGRPFPPLWTHCRISIGTMDEMKRAMPIFEEVLEKANTQAA